uniref:Uncharacterized protein n=1 Tax=Cacopsylla melanoneura TaxID=428564 RepID=A0A8D9FE95_9HEMI
MRQSSNKRSKPSNSERGSMRKASNNLKAFNEKILRQMVKNQVETSCEINYVGLMRKSSKNLKEMKKSSKKWSQNPVLKGFNEKILKEMVKNRRKRVKAIDNQTDNVTRDKGVTHGHYGQQRLCM